VTVLFRSLAVLDPSVGHIMDVLLLLSLSPVIPTDSSTGSPVYVLMLSIQAVRGLPRLRAPGIVPCIISFSRQLPCNSLSLSLCVCVCVKIGHVVFEICELADTGTYPPGEVEITRIRRAAGAGRALLIAAERGEERSRPAGRDGKVGVQHGDTLSHA